MAETIKVTKKDIQAAKAPDAVLEAGTSAFDWIVAHRNALLGALAAIIVVAIVASAVQGSSEKKRHETGAELAKAVALANRPVTEGKPTGEESFATAAEKKTAVEKAFGDVIAAHPDTDAARVAALELSIFKLRDGDADGAIPGLEQYLEKSSSQDMKLLALESLGYAYEKKGDLAKANDAFSKLSDAGTPARALYHRARIAGLQGNKEDARKLYEQVTKEYAEDPIASDAKVRLELLDLAPATEAGITAPPPAPEQPAAPAKGKGAKGKGK